MNQRVLSAERGSAAIQQAILRRREQGQKALIPYIMAGDPDLETTKSIAQALANAGADVIELGMPFSDPVADGPVIQKAGERALRRGVTMKNLLQTVKEIRNQSNTPIVIMTYYNLFYHYGLEAYARDAAVAGVDGLIVPDLPPEEGEEFSCFLEKQGLALVYLIAPTSTDERIQRIARLARGFIYYVSRMGVTGERSDISQDLKANLQRIRAVSDLPVAVGFGVSTPEQANMISQEADGVVIGSALVRIIEESPEFPERAAAEFLKPIADALHGSAR
ncbi:MAG: tryptophan synthase subunit alpha [Candidatus Omnitrophota bacterium]